MGSILRTNGFAILTHILINLIIFLLYRSPSLFLKYGCYGEIFFFTLAICLYTIAGYLLSNYFQKTFQSQLEILVSFAAIWIPGVLSCAYISEVGSWWIYYATPTFPLLFHFFEIDVFSYLKVIMIVFSFLPLILIRFGGWLKKNLLQDQSEHSHEISLCN